MKRILSFILAAAMLLSLIPAALAESEDGIPVALAGNPTTGYVWSITSSDDGIVRAANSSFLPENPDAAGSSGLDIWSLNAKASGEAVLTFSYARPWESSEDDIQFSLPVAVTPERKLALGDVLTMPTIPNLDYYWLAVQDELETISLQAGEQNGTFQLSALADGSNVLTFGYLSPSNTRMLWAFVYEVTVQDGAVYLDSLTFYRDEDLDPFVSDISFTTTDREGNEYTDAIFAEYTLTVLNFWEPWCGPCVGEMPALQKLSETYADKGVLILGIYSTFEEEDEVDLILEDAGTQYPILRYCEDFDFLQTGYVPTTVVVNSQGRIVVRPFSRAMNYDAWADLIEGLL